MKILTAQQKRTLELATLSAQSISEFDLVQRAGTKLAERLLQKYPEQHKYLFFCGLGNNAADGLICATKLIEAGKDCSVIVVNHSEKQSPAFVAALDVINRLQPKLVFVNSAVNLPVIENDAFLIDALLGIGVNRAVSGFLDQIVTFINNSKPRKIIALDLPSGLSGDAVYFGGNILRVNQTFVFAPPTLSLFLADNYQYVGEWELLDIGLDKNFADQIITEFELLNFEFVRANFPLPARRKFAHKGDFGHALIVAGSRGKIGAAVLATKAALRSGAGLVTGFIPGCGYEIMQTSVPEAMVATDKNPGYIANPDIDINNFNSLGIGPGIDQNPVTAKALAQILQRASYPIVIDADAINLLSQNLTLLELVPKNSILTPHPKELARLVGESASSAQQLERQINFAKRYQLIVVLKGAHTSIAFPNGKIYFNTSGNPGMATAGSGDVLAGILTGLLAQKLPPDKAAVLGVYAHGLAGDLAREEVGEAGMIASDIIDCFPKALKKLTS